MRRWAQWAAVLAFVCTAAEAQSPEAEEIAALKARIEALEQRLEALAEKQEAAPPPAPAAPEAPPEAAVTDKTPEPEAPLVSLDGNGLRVTSADGSFESRIRLRLQYDYAWFSQDNGLLNVIGDEQDGTGFRSARVLFTGKVFDDFTYSLDIDFAGQTGADSPVFKEVFLQYNGVPYGGGRTFDVRAGHFKEPFGLDELNSDVDLMFQENPLLDVFVPSRNAGVQLSSALLGEPKKERLTWTVGVFKETDDIPSSNDSDEDQGYQITGRVTGLPYFAADGRQYVHLGAAYSLRNPDGARLRYNLRPETRLSLFRYADPDSPFYPAGFRLQDAIADDVNLLGLEAAAVFGGFTFQSEYVRSDVDSVFAGDLTYDGWYAQAGYILTGEHRPYNHAAARLGRPEPARPFAVKGERRGPGAWELAARYGSVDLSDGPILGGEHGALTLGINWYMNKNVLWSWNYIRNDIDHPLYSGDFDSLQTRLQLEF